MEPENGTSSRASPFARTCLILAACGQILSLLATLLVPLLIGTQDPDSALRAGATVRVFNLVGVLLLTLGLFGLARDLGGRWWRATFVLFVLRSLVGIADFLPSLGIRVETRWLQLALFGVGALCIVGAWVVLGLTLIVRRVDGPTGLGVTTGIAVEACMVLWTLHFLAVMGILPFDSVMIWITEMASAVSGAIALLLAGFLAGVAVRPTGPGAAVRGRTLFALGAGGSLLLVIGLIVAWHPLVGGQAFPSRALATFAVLVGLGFLGIGLGYLGQSLAIRRPAGLVAAVAVWLQTLILALAWVESARSALVWLGGLLAITAQVAGGISFLLARKLAAPAIALTAGAALLACALVSTVMLAAVGDTGVELPWMARQIVIALVQIGMLTAFTLATVHHLQVVAPPPPTTP